MKRLFLTLGAATILAAGLVNSQAGESVFQEGVNGYEGTIDTQIRGASPDRDDSETDSLNPDGSDGGQPVHVLMRFENMFGTEPNQIPPGQSIFGGTLTIWINNPGSDLNMHRMLVPWEESVTWNQISDPFDLSGVAADGTTAAVDPDVTFPAPAVVTEIELPPTTLQAWLDGTAPNHGWVFLPTGNNGVDFPSSEGTDPTQRPQLRVVWGTPGLPFLQKSIPTPQGITFLLKDGDGANAKQVNASSISLTFDGAAVTPEVSKDGEITTVAYASSSLLASGSVHSYSLSFSDNGTPPGEQTEAGSFTVPLYSTIPASLKVADSEVNKNDPGFNVKIHQMDTGRPSGNNLPDPIRQVRGELIDDFTGSSVENLVDVFYPGEDGNWVPNPSFTDSQIYHEEGAINYNQDARNDPNASAGNFGPDVPIPGIPGITASTDNIAFETTTLLELEAGFYRMGVNSDDGFVLSSSLNPRDALAVELGLFNGGRGAADTIFDFAVEESGLYPFTLYWWEGGGGANVEWFVIDPSNDEMTLVNDPSNANAVKAYRTYTGPSTYVASVTPDKNATVVPPDTSIEAVIVDLGNASVELTVNGQAVTPTTTTSGNETTVRYDPPAPFAIGSTVNVGLKYGDLGSGWSFETQKGEKVLLVQGTATPNAADSAIIALLESFGFDVAIVEDVASQTSDADNAVLVITSSTTNSGDVTTKYRDLSIPVINWEQALQDDFLTAIDVRGTTGDQTELEIVDANHPLAAGLPAGVHAVATAASTFSWGVPNENAAVVARMNDGSGNPVIYGYDTGAILDDGATAAPARRVHLFLENDTYAVLNEDGLKLVEAALSWALDRSLQPAPVGEAAISIARSAAGATITYTGTLQSADSVTGPYTDVAGASSPAAIPFSGTARFYRSRQ